MCGWKKENKLQIGWKFFAGCMEAKTSSKMIFFPFRRLILVLSELVLEIFYLFLHKIAAFYHSFPTHLNKAAKLLRANTKFHWLIPFFTISFFLNLFFVAKFEIFSFCALHNFF